MTKPVGRPHRRTGVTPRPVEERFWRFVSPCPNTGCWWWTGAYQRKGYGHIGLGSRDAGNIVSTRLSYRMHYGVDPGDLFVCHRCDNTGCVNPEHLFLGTNADNMRDCQEKGRTRRGFARVLGERHGNAKLTNAAVLAIRASSASGEALAEQFGVGRSTISQVRLGKIWKHVESAS